MHQEEERIAPYGEDLLYPGKTGAVIGIGAEIRMMWLDRTIMWSAPSFCEALNKSP
jgi:hypothetical protein